MPGRLLRVGNFSTEWGGARELAGRSGRGQEENQVVLRGRSAEFASNDEGMI